MALARWKSGLVVLLSSCTIASVTIVATSERSFFTPEGDLIYVNIYSTHLEADSKFVYSFAQVNFLPEIQRVQGVGNVTILGDRGNAVRIRLDPARMRANNLTPQDIKNALLGCSMVDSPERRAMHFEQSKQYELTHVGRATRPEQYENIVLKAAPDGEVLKLKDVGKVELDSSFHDMFLDVDGFPAAMIVVKPTHGSNASKVIEAVKAQLKQIKPESIPPGIEYQVVPADRRDLIYAAVELPQGSTFEYVSAKCQEVAAIAKSVEGVSSVTSLAGYQIRTENRNSSAGSFLIQLQDRADRKQPSGQIIKELEEKCRTMNFSVEFFEPPAVPVFVAAGGFSVRVLGMKNSNTDVRPDSFLDELLNRKDLANLFKLLASKFPHHELVIKNDVAIKNGVSIASSLQNLTHIVGDDKQTEQKLSQFVADPSRLSLKNDRGVQVPFSTFMEFKTKQGTIDR